MATSSIFENFDINDKKDAETFAKALIESYNYEKEHPKHSSVKYSVLGKEDIRKIWGKKGSVNA